MKNNWIAIAVVGALIGGTVPSHADDWGSETDKKVIAGAIKNFEAELRGIGSTAHITSCSHVVSEAQGRIGTAFGAICTLKTQKQNWVVLLCQSDAIGSFGLSKGELVNADSETGEFMEKYCMSV